ncbi:RICIN domain-containing protein [Spirosoma radiotolerans]|uniref:RICIN domain-containing protein n=1 Tax=Spirosoma radiotolerans TaxID=1379870 RepID=UPI00069880E4|nr:RICIN domain-containing protein [Spirosoma radiotolerans]
MNSIFTLIPKPYAVGYRFAVGLLCWLGSQITALGLPIPTSFHRTGEIAKRYPATQVSAMLALPVSVSGVEAGKCYRLVSRLSGKVLGVSGTAQSDGDPLTQQTDANKLMQGWRFTATGGDYYTIQGLATQKAMQVNGSSTAEDALVEQWTYWGGAHQQWRLVRNGEGYFTILNRNSGKAITVRNASTAEGAAISQQTAGAGQNQQWSIEERSCTATATNQAPVVVATSTPLTGSSPLSVTFTGSKSYDPDGDPITYEWNFGDGSSFSTEANPVKVFTAKPGSQGVGLILNYTVQLTVIDSKGLRSPVQTFAVRLNSTNPTVQITNPVNNAKYALDKSTSYTLGATVTGSGIQSQIWQVKLRHNNSEQLVKTTSGTNPVIDISPVGCDGDDYYYVISVKVTDYANLSGQDSVRIYPDCNSAKLNVIGLTATPISNGSIRLNWTNPTLPFDKVLVVGRAGSGLTNIPLEPAYTANASFTGNGSELPGGGKVLYQGTSNSVVVTDLTAGQPYYFRVYAHAGNGWSGGVEVSTTPTSVTANRPPVVVATTTSLTGTSPLSVTFTGDKSYDPDGDQLFYEWAFSDGTYLNVANPVKTFTPQIGQHGSGSITRFTAQLTVTDSKGQRSTSQVFTISLTDNTAPTADKCYRLVSRLSGKVLGVSGTAQSDGDKLTQQTDATKLVQGWRFTATSGDYYSIQALSTTKGIQVAGSSTADDALLEQWTYWGGAHQQWRLVRNADGYFTILNRNSGKAITVRNASTAEGGQISQMTLGAGQEQQWSIVERTCTTGARVGAMEAGIAIKLWPNPANDHVLVDLSPVIGQPVGLEVNDLLGRSIQQIQLDAASAEPYRFNTSQLPNGLYLIRLTPAGQLPTTLRLLIQR